MQEPTVTLPYDRFEYMRRRIRQLEKERAQRTAAIERLLRVVEVMNPPDPR